MEEYDRENENLKFNVSQQQHVSDIPIFMPSSSTKPTVRRNFNRIQPYAKAQLSSQINMVSQTPLQTRTSKLSHARK